MIRVGQEKSIRIAYREDAPPFSYKDKIGEVWGFMVDLCRVVAKHWAGQRSLCPGYRRGPVRGDHPAAGRPSFTRLPSSRVTIFAAR
jgi:ABC-type amino acid transport substrate-binding protein